MVQLEGLMKLLKVTHSHTDCLLFSSMVYCRTWEGKVSLVSSHLLKSVLASLLPLAVSSFNNFTFSNSDLFLTSSSSSPSFFLPVCFPTVRVVAL